MRHVLAFLLVLAAPVASANAQARLSTPRRPPADSSATDSMERPEPVRPAPAERERELDRLRRRTGTASAPALPERGPRRPPTFTADGGFEVRIDTDSPEYLVGETDDETEPMYIRLQSAEDGYLTLVSGGVGRDLAVLTPNDLIASFPIRADEPVDFPLRDWVQQGLELRPQLPADLDVAQQSLIAVVTRRPISLPLADYNLADPRDGDRRIAVRTFQAWLARLPVAQRGIGQTFYLVRRR